MKKFKFLFKPLFFIFNLIFATWLVLTIENLQPSDFGHNKLIIKPPAKTSPVNKQNKDFFRKLAIEYKAGLIDSVKLERQLDNFFETGE